MNPLSTDSPKFSPLKKTAYDPNYLTSSPNFNSSRLSNSSHDSSSSKSEFIVDLRSTNVDCVKDGVCSCDLCPIFSILPQRMIFDTYRGSYTPSCITQRHSSSRRTAPGLRISLRYEGSV